MKKKQMFFDWLKDPTINIAGVAKVTGINAQALYRLASGKTTYIDVRYLPALLQYAKNNVEAKKK